MPHDDGYLTETESDIKPTYDAPMTVTGAANIQQDTTHCIHPSDAIFYNKYNGVIQCHRCGQSMHEASRWKIVVDMQASEILSLQIERKRLETIMSQTAEYLRRVRDDRTGGMVDRQGRMKAALDFVIAKLVAEVPNEGQSKT